VPYWWDRKIESLAATIYSHRPDLFAEPPAGTPIPLIEPSLEQKQKSELQGNKKHLK
jgi:hypothetical protein